MCPFLSWIRECTEFGSVSAAFSWETSEFRFSWTSHVTFKYLYSPVPFSFQHRQRHLCCMALLRLATCLFHLARCFCKFCLKLANMLCAVTKLCSESCFAHTSLIVKSLQGCDSLCVFCVYSKISVDQSCRPCRLKNSKLV